MHLIESRPIRRTLCFLLLWGIIVMAILQFRKYPMLETLYLKSQQQYDTSNANSAAAAAIYKQQQQKNVSSAAANDRREVYNTNNNNKDYWIEFAMKKKTRRRGQDASVKKKKEEEEEEEVIYLEPKTDKSAVVSEEQLIEQIQNVLPNLPISYWNGQKNKVASIFYKNESCAKFPNIYDLEFNNLYWQTLHSSNGSFYLYGAYYDIRNLSRIGPSVRILGMINRIEPTVKTYCQFWFADHKEPVVVKTMEYKYIWYKKWGNYKQGILQPYLIACQIPSTYHSLVPVSVSLVERICDTSSNNLRVIYNKPEPVASAAAEEEEEDEEEEEGGNQRAGKHWSNGKGKGKGKGNVGAAIGGAKGKKGFAVCVKGLDFLYSDLSVRLVEWIELLGQLGADKIFFYQLNVHPNVSKVLHFYEKRGQVHVTSLTLAGAQPNLPGLQHLYLSKKVNHKRQNELIPYNDCLYKNLYRYEYIVLLDIDEVIMPMKVRNWRQLMTVVLQKALSEKNETRASYNVRNVYFLDHFMNAGAGPAPNANANAHAHSWFKQIPPYMHMLQHVYRSKNYTKPNQYIKCFHNPERALTLHNHFPLACLSQGCTSYAIDTNDAQLQHYRADCVKTLKKTCTEFKKNSILDTTIWRYKDELIKRTLIALRHLDFL